MANKTYQTLEQAQELLLQRTRMLGTVERLPLLEAVNRVGAEAIRAAVAQPPFDRSPLDGYALRHQDTLEASGETPVKLRVTQRIFAGDCPQGALKAGEAARIMTGGMLPPGADCVIRQEDTDQGETEVLIYSRLSKHENYCFRGEDVRQGELLISRGQSLGYADIGVLAGQGFVDAKVFHKPRVAVISSGDELTAPGDPLAPGKIYNGNSFLLASRLKILGMIPTVAPNSGDDISEQVARIQALLRENDMVITTGGVSVGQKDYMPTVAERLGGQILFHGVAIKPGAPALGMAKDGKILLCLSGNPFAAAATFEVLAVPVLKKLAGHSSFMLIRVKGICRSNFVKPIGTRHLVRANMIGGAVLIPDRGHKSGMLSSFRDCNCLVDLPAETSNVQKGSEVEVILL